MSKVLEAVNEAKISITYLLDAIDINQLRWSFGDCGGEMEAELEHIKEQIKIIEDNIKELQK
jgi:hypothetical protein